MTTVRSSISTSTLIYVPSLTGDHMQCWTVQLSEHVEHATNPWELKPERSAERIWRDQRASSKNMQTVYVVFVVNNRTGKLMLGPQKPCRESAELSLTAEARCGGALLLVCTPAGPGISALLLNTGQLSLGRMWTGWRADHTHAQTPTHTPTPSGGEERHDSPDGMVVCMATCYCFQDWEISHKNVIMRCYLDPWPPFMHIFFPSGSSADKHICIYYKNFSSLETV